MIIKFLKAFLDHSNCKNVVIPKEMEEEGTLSLIPQSKYVPVELIHHIQSLLPEKDAARTCVLSKSWLHAWSTIPTLRFTTFVSDDNLAEREEINYIKLIDRTLLRYLNDNMPIECLRLHLGIEKLSLPSPVENWFQVLASGNCLKELFLTICGKKLARNTTEADRWLTINIPNAIFSSENLNTLSLVAANNIGRYQLVRMNIIPVIKCSCLRVLVLVGVCISEGAFNNLLSSCSLLEKIHIYHSEHLKIIKVINLRRLHELKIILDHHDSLELYDVPRLRLFAFSYLSRYDATRMATLGSVRELDMHLKLVDKAFLDVIKSKFPFLEILTLTITCMLETIDITGVSLKRLTLNLGSSNQINIQVFASKLLYFCCNGLEMHSLLFPYGTPAHIKLRLSLHKYEPKDLSYFLKMRETLDLSSSFDIEIVDNFVPLDIDLDDLKRMVPFPARNVQQLSFGKNLEKKLWKHSPFIDFLFSICYPRYVKVFYRSSNCKNYWYEQMVEMMEKKRCDLKDIEIKNPSDGKWESLTSSWRSSHSLFELPWRSFINDEGNDYNSDEFKLNWRS